MGLLPERVGGVSEESNVLNFEVSFSWGVMAWFAGARPAASKSGYAALYMLGIRWSDPAN
jgi:hypothetical protein